MEGMNMLKRNGLAIVLALLPVIALSVSIGTAASQSVPVNVMVQKHAAIDVIQGAVRFGLLSGAPGIYHLDGSLFLGRALQIWGSQWPVFRVDGGNHQGRTGLGIVKVTSNCNVNVGMQFVWQRQDLNWLQSETLFGVWTDSPGGYFNRFFGKARSTPTSVSWSQLYASLKQQTYVIVGGILIENIYQQPAGDYWAEIAVTVSCP